MIIDASEIKKAIKPKADSTLNNMKKSELIEYIRCLEHNYNTAVWFNGNQARYIEKIGIENVRSQWISVKERLPADKKDEYVLVVCDYHGKISVETRKKWNLDSSVTHWMPLPEPPKEDAE